VTPECVEQWLVRIEREDHSQAAYGPFATEELAWGFYKTVQMLPFQTHWAPEPLYTPITKGSDHVSG